VGGFNERGRNSALERVPHAISCLWSANVVLVVWKVCNLLSTCNAEGQIFKQPGCVAIGEVASSLDCVTF
jgi:hypothetical protein